MSLINCSKVIYKPVIIHLPDKPNLPDVKFQSLPDGVKLDFQQAKNLAEREIMIQSYIQRLIRRIEINNAEAER